LGKCGIKSIQKIKKGYKQSIKKTSKKLPSKKKIISKDMAKLFLQKENLKQLKNQHLESDYALIDYL
jgi:hypothetical protein